MMEPLCALQRGLEVIHRTGIGSDHDRHGRARRAPPVLPRALSVKTTALPAKWPPHSRANGSPGWMLSASAHSCTHRLVDTGRTAQACIGSHDQWQLHSSADLGSVFGLSCCPIQPGLARPATCWLPPNRSHESPRRRGLRPRGPAAPARHRIASARERKIFALRRPHSLCRMRGPGWRGTRLQAAGTRPLRGAGGRWGMSLPLLADRCRRRTHRQHLGGAAVSRGAFLVTDLAPASTVAALEIREDLVLES
jgi:hypothetical protein